VSKEVRWRARAWRQRALEQTKRGGLRAHRLTQARMHCRQKAWPHSPASGLCSTCAGGTRQSKASANKTLAACKGPKQAHAHAPPRRRGRAARHRRPCSVRAARRRPAPQRWRQRRRPKLRRRPQRPPPQQRRPQRAGASSCVAARPRARRRPRWQASARAEGALQGRPRPPRRQPRRREGAPRAAAASARALRLAGPGRARSESRAPRGSASGARLDS